MLRRLRSLLPLVLGVAMLAAPGPSFAQITAAVSITVAPPPLPLYVQPPIPGPGYLWVPGYWAYGPAGYYWVPGTWVMPPAAGLLWTPGYWGWNDGVYAWHAGYWGPHVGFYGGINYGFGYFGTGFAGGFWDHDVFHYNRAVTNVTNVRVVSYSKTVVVKQRTRVSFNGGVGGTRAPLSASAEAASREAHHERTGVQEQHERAAGGNHALLASENHGRPHVAATSHAGTFSGRGVVAARGEPRPAAPQPQPQPQPHGNEHAHEQHRDEHHD